MTKLVLFLEELSAKAMLQELLPRIVGENLPFQFIVFEGKQDLEKQLPRKLRKWNTPDCGFVVLRDKDRGDCELIRQDLINKCRDAGKPDTLVRIAVHELESWYLGDLRAVEAGLDITNLSRLQGNVKYRNPDRLANPAEEMEKITDFKYQKVSGSRAIGPHLSLEQNRSHSFNKFIAGIERIIEADA